ncbi:MAG: hypothetical protein ACK4VN_05745 [Bacteroidales bacterium]
MKTPNRKYEMLVNQFRSNFFRIRLVEKNRRRRDIIFETFSDTIPSTRELLERYALVNATS